MAVFACAGSIATAIAKVAREIKANGLCAAG